MSYRSSSTLVTVDLLLHELLTFVQNLFSWLFFRFVFCCYAFTYFNESCKHKLPYEELQINFDFRHGWPTFSWVIALGSKFVLLALLGYAITYLNENLVASFHMKSYRWKFDFFHGWSTFSWVIAFLFKIHFLGNALDHISKWKLVGSFHMKSYRSSSTFFIVNVLFHEFLQFVKNRFSGFFFFHLKSYRLNLKDHK